MMSLGEDSQSKVLSELSSLVLNIILSPPTPVDFSDNMVASPSEEVVRRRRRKRGPNMEQITPAGIAYLLLGVSLALMLCGSVAFFIGFLLMPWVIGFAMVFYVVGVFSGLSMLGRAILCCSPLLLHRERIVLHGNSYEAVRCP